MLKPIRKADFALQHEVTRLLRKAGWTAINNKYYIDDNEDTGREIGIVAYNATLSKIAISI